MQNLNENQAIVRNESDRVRDPEVPQVRKISRFQVSHVKEAEESMKPSNIIHGGDVLLENISPEQKQSTQIAQDFMAHNIQQTIDNSPEKIDTMLQQQQQMASHIQKPEVPLQPQIQHDQSTMHTQGFVQPQPQSQSQPQAPSQLQPLTQPILPQMQPTTPNYPLMDATQVINQQALQTSMPSILPPQSVPMSVSSMPSQLNATPSRPPQPAVVPQQQQQQQQQIK